MLEGLDGVKKMSKSLNNYIGVDESPDEIFGKVMSISDDLMWRYFELLSFRPMEEIAQFKSDVEAGANPRDIKFHLGQEIVARFYDQVAATRAQENFVARFQKGAMPDEIRELDVKARDGVLPIANLLKEAELTKGTGEAMRMIKQGAVKIDGKKVSDSKLEISSGSTAVYQVGKRKFAKVTVV